jgi:SH3-like domain-containing protein
MDNSDIKKHFTVEQGDKFTGVKVFNCTKNFSWRVDKKFILTADNPSSHNLDISFSYREADGYGAVFFLFTYSNVGDGYPHLNNLKLYLVLDGSTSLQFNKVSNDNVLSKTDKVGGEYYTAYIETIQLQIEREDFEKIARGNNIEFSIRFGHGRFDGQFSEEQVITFKGFYNSVFDSEFEAERIKNTISNPKKSGNNTINSKENNDNSSILTNDRVNKKFDSGTGGSGNNAIRDNQNNDNSTISKNEAVNSKFVRNIIIVIAGIALWYFSDAFTHSNSTAASDNASSKLASNDENSSSAPDNNSLQSNPTDKALALMTHYYDENNQGILSAKNFFDPFVEQFITKTNTNPSEIQAIIDNNEEFLEKSTTLDTRSFRYARTVNGIDYFDYWLFFHCYRVSKQKIQECRINIEIGMTSTGKIRSYVEKNVTDLVFKEPGDEDAVFAYIIDPPSNLRSCPNTTCEVVAECTIKDEQIKILSEEGNWALIETQNGARGYLHNTQYSSQSNAKVFTATVDKLRFRETPSFNGIVIREVPVGSKFTYLNEKTNILEAAKIQGQELPGYWYRVRSQDGREGWIHGCCISGI